MTTPINRGFIPQDPKDLTDSFNSEKFYELHRNQIIYLDVFGKWYIFDKTEHRWIVDPKGVRVRELAKSVYQYLQENFLPDVNDKNFKAWVSAIKYSASSRGISGMVDLARGLARVLTHYEDLDHDPYLLGVKNGVVDLRSGELRTGDPKDLITKQCNTSYQPDSSVCPTWTQCLEEWLPDEEVRDYFQKLCGHALIGAQRHHLFVIHYGDGRNGKGTAMRAMQHVLSSYACVPHMSLIVANQNQQHDTVKATLFRRRLAIASETDRKVSLKESDIKNLTGGDRITARGMRQDPWEFDPSHSLWLCTNHLPEISGRDDGIWSRVKVVPWEQSFLGKEDPDLDQKLKKEAPSILNWMVQGCLMYQEEGLDTPDVVRKHTLKYQKSEDKIRSFMDSHGFSFDPGAMTSKTNLHTSFITWCREEGLNEKDMTVLRNSYFNEHGVTETHPRINGGRVRMWVGIRGPVDPMEQAEQG